MTFVVASNLIPLLQKEDNPSEPTTEGNDALLSRGLRLHHRAPTTPKKHPPQTALFMGIAVAIRQDGSWFGRFSALHVRHGDEHGVPEYIRF